ncbi:thioredoxin family protein [Celeribacter sp.]|uniref:thioredoxin family protein n=1 Tax=Celeribacter sp. TaxID=1890673 RepID=UPI003A93F6D0
MKRRDFILTAAAASGALALSPVAATAAPMVFTPGVVAKELAAGKTVFLDFKASWCSTCAAQERVIAALKAANPAYEQNISFVDVDWDDYGRHEFTKSLNIPRRSTLVVLKGDQELGRIVAQTGESEIKALMDTALNAATM